MKKTLTIIVVLMLATVFMAADNSLAQGDQPEINTLKDLKGIGVGVGNIEPDAAADGLSKTKLLGYIFEKLKKSGIKVYTDLELSTISGQPILVLNVNTLKQPGPIYIYTVALDFNQIVVLQRSPGLTSISPTWTVLATGGSLPEDLSASVQASIDPMIDSFIADYQKANPK